MNQINVNLALKKFDELLSSYDNLPNYVYTAEYKYKFYYWIRELYEKDCLKSSSIIELLNLEENIKMKSINNNKSFN
ncbi:TPA: hypothetical protein KPJ62_003699 [Clostridioides difficile]|nr:hypothetical protein [Clostridioides difficile]